MGIQRVCRVFPRFLFALSGALMLASCRTTDTERTEPAAARGWLLAR